MNSLNTTAQAARNHAAVANEGGAGYNPHAAAHAAAVRAAADARIDALVPRFAELREAFNRAVIQHSVNGKLTVAALAKVEAEVGCTRSELLAAKARVA